MKLKGQLAITADCTPTPTDCATDAMVIIQKHKAREPDNFCRACEYLISKAQDQTKASACGRTDAILVVYIDESIKNAE